MCSVPTAVPLLPNEPNPMCGHRVFTIAVQAAAIVNSSTSPAESIKPDGDCGIAARMIKARPTACRVDVAVEVDPVRAFDPTPR